MYSPAAAYILLGFSSGLEMCVLIEARGPAGTVTECCQKADGTGQLSSFSDGMCNLWLLA